VAGLLPPSILAVTANLALTIIGKVVVNINYGTANDIVNYTITNSGIEQVVTCGSFLEQLNLNLSAELLDMRRLRSWEDTTVHQRVQSLLANPVISRFEYEFAGFSAELSDIAAVLYTSGSTGKPKGVELSHRSILSNVQAILQQYPPRLLPSGAVEDETILGALTFAHSLGYTGTLWAAVLLGFKAVYITNPLDARSVCRAVEQHKVTIFITAPTLMRLYLIRAKKQQFASVQTLLLGSEKLKPELRRDIQTKLGLNPCEAYGVTELGPIISLSVPRQLIGSAGQAVWGNREGSVGLPVAGTELAIVDTVNGELVKGFGPEHQGEIWVKGAQVMSGYLGNPEATVKVLVFGWYRTGDIGYLDQDGFIFITDRLSRFAKISGEMVPMAQVESLIRNLTKQDELSVHVTCVPDTSKGERLVVLFSSLGSLDVTTLLAGLKAQLPALWLPKASDFIPALMPIGSTGKLDMQRLKAMAIEHSRN
jgi:acyl-[acyl-carrier-protein]-phospholipid O-acyltransferase/long-chain-fatty-acid--[acyl-carrier-protein] ligase